MRVLVVSDTHRGLSFMLRCARAVKPDAVIHLGDFYEDGEELRDALPSARAYLVAGNCDRYAAPIYAQDLLIQKIGGVKFYLTHGHREQVKSGTARLADCARREECQVALYGHTHRPEWHWEPDGMLVMNPGEGGTYGGTAGLLEVQDGAVVSCRILGESDLEEFEA